MGNCTAKGTVVDCSLVGRDGHGGVVRIMTETCRMIEYKGPVRVEDITIPFPRHGVFRQGDVLTPLHSHDLLTDDQLYYLFPLVSSSALPTGRQATGMVNKRKARTGSGSGRSSPPAMDRIRRPEVLPSTANGVWRVKLAINASQLADILSEEVNTEALIERMRIFASSPQLWQKRGST